MQKARRTLARTPRRAAAVRGRLNGDARGGRRDGCQSLRQPGLPARGLSQALGAGGRALSLPWPAVVPGSAGDRTGRRRSPAPLRRRGGGLPGPAARFADRPDARARQLSAARPELAAVRELLLPRCRAGDGVRPGGYRGGHQAPDHRDSRGATALGQGRIQQRSPTLAGLRGIGLEPRTLRHDRRSLLPKQQLVRAGKRPLLQGLHQRARPRDQRERAAEGAQAGARARRHLDDDHGQGGIG